MHTQRLALRTAALGASLACLAACGAPGLSPMTAPGVATLDSLAPNAKAGTYLYTCQTMSLVDCLVYQNNKVTATLKKGFKKPAGVVAGADGLLYIADENAKTILVYSAGAKKLMRTLNNGGNAPLDVAVYKDEVIAANQKNLTFFKKGATKPSATLKDSRMTQGTGVAFDPSGNCYLAFDTSGSGAHVDEFKGCKGKGQDLDIGPALPYGLAFDGSGNLYYTTFASSANGVYKCTGVKSCKLILSHFYEPQYLNFTANFTDFWVSDLGNYQYGAFMYEFSTAKAKQVAKITAGLSFFNPPTGVAPGPGSL
jgi:small nuclear ribonucleoprotein (snRNP)-like protein